MKTFYKVMLSFCIGLALIFAGISLGGLGEIQIGTVFNNFDWRWNAKRINDVDYQASHLVDEFEINVHNGTINFIETDNDYIQVKASDVYDGFEVYQSDSKLIIDQSHYWKWFKRYEPSNIEIYIPRNQAIKFAKINGKAGNLNVNNLRSDTSEFNVGAGSLRMDNINCQEIKLDVGMGTASATNVTISKRLKVNVGMGTAKVELNGMESEYNYEMKAGLGTVRIGDEKVNGLGSDKSHVGTTDKYIDVDCGLGTAKVEMEG